MSKKHQATVQRQFTNTAEAFSRFAVRDSADIVAEKVEFIKPQPEYVVLDVACGPGALVLAMAPRVRYAYGMDLTREMLRHAREFQAEKHVENVSFTRGEGENLPYPDAAFDVVCCQYAFHHMPRPELVLQEMVRVAKPGGRIFINDTLGPESDEKFELHNKIEIFRDPSHTLSLRLTTFLSMFDKLNLEIISQSLKRRRRSFNRWMLRAGLTPKDKRYQETRRLLESSIPGDRAGFSPQADGNDIQIVHTEGIFLLCRRHRD
ncbi:MAG TPA: class I SAM-dependent methyltransferase [Terriglobia bacterium]|nr:class I SAM-dependent methyltransferase [Terriglobia bacterium]